MSAKIFLLALCTGYLAYACNLLDDLGRGSVQDAQRQGVAIALDARPLTLRQSIAIRHLAFPQSGSAMLTRFGEPASRDDDNDYYPLPNGGVVVVWSDARMAET